MTSAVAIETLRANYPDACYEQLREAVDAAIEALKAQDAAGDTISRKAAIGAICSACGKIDCDQTDTCEKLKFPPAQPEERTEERTETHACDLISRQAAIDALDKRFDSIPMEQTTEILLLRKDLRELPSAQPDLPIKEKCAFCPHCKNCDVNDDLSIQPCVDTISRQEVINTVRKIILGFFSTEDGAMTDTEKTLLSVNKAICNGVRELPSAQPEIIRCKDCKHHHYDGEDIPYCDRIDYGYGWKDDDYCSMAERRTDG